MFAMAAESLSAQAFMQVMPARLAEHVDFRGLRSVAFETANANSGGQFWGESGKLFNRPNAVPFLRRLTLYCGKVRHQARLILLLRLALSSS
jgi:hypothetical protein